MIGRARAAIEPGQHVHTHNVAFEELAFDYEFPAGRAIPLAQIRKRPHFSRLPARGRPRRHAELHRRRGRQQLRRAHGRADRGELSNASNCRPNVHGVVAFPHGEGCGHAIGPDTDQLRRTLAGVLDHPNVSAAIILGLGCEVNQIEHYLGPNAPESDRLVGMTVQGSRRHAGTVEAARRADRPIHRTGRGREARRMPASKIILGLNCGGSDSFSGITANPALWASARTCWPRSGRRSVLAETTEIFGAEHLLVKRARNRADSRTAPRLRR